MNAIYYKEMYYLCPLNICIRCRGGIAQTLREIGCRLNEYGIFNTNCYIAGRWTI